MNATESLREALLVSQRESKNHRHDSATQVLLDPIQQVLSGRAHSQIAKFHKQSKWPLGSVRVSRDELGFRVEAIDDGFDSEDAAALRLYAADLCSQKDAGFREGAIKLVESLCCQFMATRAAMSWQVSVCNSGAKLRWLLLTSLASYRHDLNLRSIGFSHLLKEPQARAKAILERHEQETLRRHCLRSFHQISDEMRLQYLSEFHWPELDAYKRFIEGSTQSRILVSIHMGDFLGAFSRIAQETCEDWQVFTIRRERDAAKDPLSDMRFGRGTNILRPGQFSPVQVAARLRTGRQTLAILSDLGSQFGETVEVQFLGRAANFVRGPASISLLSGCPIIPFVCYRDGEKNCIDMGAVIQSTVNDGESFAAAVTRITQQLARYCETWVVKHPHQWKYLPDVFSFFSRDHQHAKALELGV